MPAENCWEFEYLGAIFTADGKQTTDVKRRIAMAQTRHGQMRHIWNSPHLHMRLKLRLYVSAVYSVMIYGAEAWTLDAATKRALNGANSKMVSAITGRTAHEEAKAEGKTYDIVAGIRATRLRWLGQILRMGEERMLLRAVETLYENPQEGDLLMDAPATSSWAELRAMAANDRKGKNVFWAQAVRAIKDSINISTRGKRYKRKGAKTPKGKKKKKKRKKSGASAEAASAKNEETRERKEDSDEGDEWVGWKPKRTGARKKTRPPIRCHDGFMMSVQASRDHYCQPREDQGPYSAVEVGYPNRLEELLLPYSDKATTITGMRPTLYVRVPAHIISAVVAKHADICSGQLPDMIVDEDGCQLPDLTEVNEDLTEVDEDGCKWAAAAVPPSSTEESEEEAMAPTSVVHMGAAPPLPPPTPMTTTPTPAPTTGRLSPPTPLLNMTMSPIERTQEKF